MMMRFNIVANDFHSQNVALDMTRNLQWIPGQFRGQNQNFLPIGAEEQPISFNFGNLSRKYTAYR